MDGVLQGASLWIGILTHLQDLDPQQCFHLQGQLSGMDRYSSPLLPLVPLCTALPGSGTPGYKEMEPRR